MKIIRLEAANIKRLTAVEIEPTGNAVVIGGKNGAGKTSVLDAITYALGGKAGVCDEPVRRGASKGEIICTLDDLVVRRTFTPKGGGTVTVTDTDGNRCASPQAVLDKLTGKFTFDPLAFTQERPAQQLETLLSLVGVDFSEQDAERKALYDQRTIVNRETGDLRANLEHVPHTPDVPDEEVSISELVAAKDSADSANRENDVVRASIEPVKDRIEAATAEFDKAEKQIASWEACRDRAVKARKEAVAEMEQCHKEIAALAYIDTAEITERIANAEQTNQAVRQNQSRAKAGQRMDGAKVASERLTKLIEGLDNAKASTIAAAKMPVEGLGFNEAGVTFGGLPFDQCSSAEQLRVSVAMGLAMNPTLKVLLIRDGSLLDEDSLRMVAEMAEAAGGQVWIERVGEGSECQVIIESGHVKAEEAGA